MQNRLNVYHGDLWRVEMPYYVAGFIVQNGSVIHAAPILKWTIGRPLQPLLRQLRAKGATVEWRGR